MQCPIQASRWQQRTRYLMGGAQVKLGLTLEGSLWLCVCVCVCVHMCVHVCVKSSLCQVLTMQDLIEFSFF